MVGSFANILERMEASCSPKYLQTPGRNLVETEVLGENLSQCRFVHY
jgi:hypothetical protein